MKKKIIILEGADKLGKSYQAKMLSLILEFKLLNQPNQDNTLGYLRQELKYNKDIDITVRQMFHGFQNSVDIFEFPKDDGIIMDRCYLSNIVYSKIFGVDTSVINMMIKMNKTIWEKYLKDYEIILIVFCADKPYGNGNKNDVYEDKNNWQSINLEYLTPRWKYIFPENVKHDIINVTNKTKDEVTIELIKKLLAKIKGD